MMNMRVFSGMSQILIMAAMFTLSSLADDALQQERFGITRSEPVYSGYVFVNGHYVDAPYVIEQRGVGLFVNGHRYWRLVEERWFPGQYQTPLYEDPGTPDDIDEETSIRSAIDHPVSRKKEQYWRTMELSDNDYIRRYIDYYNSLPNIAEVVPSNTTDPLRSSITLLHHDGTTWGLRFRNTGKIIRRLPAFPGSETIMVRILSNRESAIRRYTDQRMLIVSGNGKAQWKREPPDGWQAVVRVLESGHVVADKIDQLHRLGFISDEELEDASEKLGALLTDFKATDQLRQRLAGDDSWIETARERTESLSSGLVQMPDFVDRDVARPAPPPDDLGENRLGWRRSEPMVSGYFFVDGQYIDPPYVVEQRGYGIFINGFLCEKAPHRTLIFANHQKAEAERMSRLDPLEPDERKALFGEPLLLEDRESAHRLLERVLRLHDWVCDYLGADGFVIVEQNRLCALHNERWQRAWHDRLLNHFLPYDHPLEHHVNNSRIARYRVEIMREMFVPGYGAIREKKDLEEAFNAAMERYGNFVLNHLKLTPGFWKRMAGGSVWLQFVDDNMPEGPFGTVQPAALPDGAGN